MQIAWCDGTTPIPHWDTHLIPEIVLCISATGQIKRGKEEEVR